MLLGQISSSISHVSQLGIRLDHVPDIGKALDTFGVRSIFFMRFSVKLHGNVGTVNFEVWS